MKSFSYLLDKFLEWSFQRKANKIFLKEKLGEKNAKSR